MFHKQIGCSGLGCAKCVVRDARAKRAEEAEKRGAATAGIHQESSILKGVDSLRQYPSKLWGSQSAQTSGGHQLPEWVRRGLENF